VPVVLIKLSETENVITPLTRFGMRAFLTVPVQAASPAILRARSARPSTDLPSAAAQRQVCAHARTGGVRLQLTGQANSYMTRISAIGAGASGPHPAREPEPV
jgi:hypothetical protein